jgi:epoxyqueuosine reductase
MKKKELNKPHITQIIREEAVKFGFLDCGFSKIRPLNEYREPYLNWLRKGHHAGMAYMEQNIDKRIDPALLVDGAKSVITFLYNYYALEKLRGSELQIAKYAHGKDYHEVIGDKLKQLTQLITNMAGEVVHRSFVDTAPIMERVWAQNCGLGWIGKNSCLISRSHGSFVFIAEIITSLELDEDNVPSRDYCGSCRRCINSCPTEAIAENRTIDSNKCISYQTIENRGDIPLELKGKFHHYIFGCDICQDVCPWNRRAKAHAEPLFHLKPEIRDMTLDGWKNLDEKTYQTIFQKSAVKRAKYAGLKRNINFVTSKS